MTNLTANFFADLSKQDAHAATLLARAAVSSNFDVSEMWAVCRYIERTTGKHLYNVFDTELAIYHGFAHDLLGDYDTFQALHEEADAYLTSLKTE